MSRAIALMLTTFGATAAPGHAATKQTPHADDTRRGRCVIAVKGRTYLSGPCTYQMTGGGGFEVYDSDPKSSLYAIVDVRGATATGNWNAHNGADFDGDLGTLTRHGACWSNRQARVCLWRR